MLVTKPEVGTAAWGLVDEGKQQAKKVSFEVVCVYLSLLYLSSHRQVKD